MSDLTNNYNLEERTAKFSGELRALSTACPEKVEVLRALWKEAQELTMIFQKIITTLRGKKTDNNFIEN